jgi:hypothetical protein
MALIEVHPKDWPRHPESYARYEAGPHSPGDRVFMGFTCGERRREVFIAQGPTALHEEHHCEEECGKLCLVLGGYAYIADQELNLEPLPTRFLGYTHSMVPRDEVLCVLWNYGELSAIGRSGEVQVWDELVYDNLTIHEVQGRRILCSGGVKAPDIIEPFEVVLGRS